MSQTLGDQIETAMASAGIKPRTFAALVGCHYSTIYEILKNRETVVPLRLVQERVFAVLDFISASVQGNLLPLKGKISLDEKTRQLEAMYKSYMAPKSKD